MKKESVVLFFVCLVVLCMVGLSFAQDDMSTYKSCKYCGMDRTMFGYSRSLVTYDDGTAVGTCSIHCTAIELALNIDKMPKSIEVGDYISKNLIDASKAFWVVGGNKQGVMTKRAKWAFANRDDAEKFIAENGGSLVTFDEAIKGSYEDMYADTNMIREKRKMKMMQVKEVKEH